MVAVVTLKEKRLACRLEVSKYNERAMTFSVPRLDLSGGDTRKVL
jgi:hypothetical protein